MKKLLLPILLIIFLSNILFSQNQSVKDSLLFTAVKANDFEKVKSLVEQGANINSTDSNKATILMWAAYKSDLEMVKYLVEKGADYKKKGTIPILGGYYGSLMAIASGEKKIDLLKYLIEGCKININDREYDSELKADSGWTALQWAYLNSYWEIIYYLLSNDAEADLYTYLNYGLEDIVLNKIANNPKLIYEKNEKGEDLLFRAIYYNANKVVKKILESGIDINVKDNEGDTPLYKSLYWFNYEAALLLIENGAFTNAVNSKGISIYQIALYRGFNDIAMICNKSNSMKDKEKIYEPELVIQSGHSNNIKTIDLSRNKDILLSCSYDNIIVWDILQNKEIKKISNKSNNRAAFFLKDKNHILCRNDEGILLSDIYGNEIRNFNIIGEYTLSPDSSEIIYGQADLKKRDIKTGKDLGLFLIGKPGNHIKKMCLSNDGKFILVYNIKQSIFDGEICLWSIENKKLIWEKHIDGYISEIKISKDDNNIVFSNSDSTLNVLDLLTGSNIKSFGKVNIYDQGPQMIFSPDKKYFVYTDINNNIVFLNSGDFSETGKFIRENQMTTALYFCDSSNIIITGGDKSINYWDIESLSSIKTLKQSIKPVYQLIKKDNERVISMSLNCYNDFNFKNNKYESAIIDSTKFCTFYLSPDGNFVSTNRYSEGLVTIYKKETNGFDKLIEKKTSPHRFANHVIISPNNEYFAFFPFDKSVRIYDIKKNKEIYNIKPTQDTICYDNFAFSPNMEYFALLTVQNIQNFTNPKIKLYNFKTGKLINELNCQIGRFDFSSDSKLIIFDDIKGNVQTWDLINSYVTNEYSNKDYPFIYKISDNNKYFASLQYWGNLEIVDRTEKKLLSSYSSPKLSSMTFSNDCSLLITGGYDGSLNFYNIEKKKKLFSLFYINSSDWIAITPDAQFDASPNAMKIMHFTVQTEYGYETIDLEQLKERYYEPGLLQKLLGYNSEPLRDVKGFNDVKLYPDIKVTAPTTSDKFLRISLTDRGGGIGKVKVIINGKEFTGDARDASDFNPDEKILNLKVDISKSPYLLPGTENKIEVYAFNKEGYLSSRAVEVKFIPEGLFVTETPNFYGIIIGISNYEGEKLRLRYSSKDADDIGKALKIGAGKLFGESRAKIKIINTDENNPDQPNKQNIINAFESLQNIKQNDIMVVYLSGHGVNLGSGTENEDFYYLTKEARTGNLEDPEIRKMTSISSKELTDLMLKIPAMKQVLILDVCGSGKVVDKLSEKRDIPSSQIRAFERMKDRVGLNILSGCAADAVSYEASKYAQGLLTYSLLMGMKGGAVKEDGLVDVNRLFRFSEDEVPKLASNIGGIQQPKIFGSASFDIGLVAGEDKKLIPLSNAKPLILQSRFQDANRFIDHLGIEKKVNELLIQLSYGNRDAKMVFVDASEFPDAYSIVGQYSINNNSINLNVKIFKGQEEKKGFNMTGDVNKIDNFVKKVIEETENTILSK